MIRYLHFVPAIRSAVAIPIRCQHAFLQGVDFSAALQWAGTNHPCVSGTK